MSSSFFLSRIATSRFGSLDLMHWRFLQEEKQLLSHHVKIKAFLVENIDLPVHVFCPCWSLFCFYGGFFCCCCFGDFFFNVSWKSDLSIFLFLITSGLMVLPDMFFCVCWCVPQTVVICTALCLIFLCFVSPFSLIHKAMWPKKCHRSMGKQMKFPGNFFLPCLLKNWRTSTPWLLLQSVLEMRRNRLRNRKV